jgi:hypothetical protein
MDRMKLAALKPTQMTVGFDYVEAKKVITARYSGSDLEKFLRAHAVRVVLGPAAQAYVVDHHHWACAWIDLGLTDAPVSVISDLRALEASRFWRKMESKGWVHPFDAQGDRRRIGDLPPTLADMTDDPYHSLAAFARRAGAYRKPAQAYVSFVWADFLRVRVGLPNGGAGAFSLALLQAIKAARSRAAAELPGYIGR